HAEYTQPQIALTSAQGPAGASMNFRLQTVPGSNCKPAYQRRGCAGECYMDAAARRHHAPDEAANCKSALQHQHIHGNDTSAYPRRADNLRYRIESSQNADPSQACGCGKDRG